VNETPEKGAQRTLVIHPFLLAVFPALSLLSHNISETYFPEVLLPGAAMLAFGTLVFFVAYAIVRNWSKAGILASLLCIFFLAYGPLFYVPARWLCQSLGFGAALARDRFVLLFCALAFAFAAYLTIRTRRSLHKLTKVLNAFGICVVVIPVIEVVAYEIRTTRYVPRDLAAASAPAAVPPTSRTAAPLRDIYYIVLDRYADLTTLRDVYDHDNRPFYAFLRDKGFYVASKSCANYPRTSHSLSACLNMHYLDSLAKCLGEESSDLRPLFATIEDYKVWRFLKQRGYTFIHCGTCWEPTRRNRYADINVNYFPLPEFTQVAYQSTMLRPLDIIGFRRIQWERVRYKFDRLADVPKMPEPTFVFAHMLVPHPPYTFDKDGSFLTRADVRARDGRENYIRQLICVNAMMEKLIGSLLSTSRSRPIVIVQADEGPHPPRAVRTGYPSFKWREATRQECREKLRIINAYYLPDVDTSTLYPSISPVNTFRVVFNLYFGTRYELLPDRSYAYESLRRRPYKFFDVTDAVKHEQ
jgi:hypothetical protein